MNINVDITDDFISNHSGFVFLNKLFSSNKYKNIYTENDLSVENKNGFSDKDILSSILSLCSMGKMQFSSITDVKDDPVFLSALDVNESPSEEILRQRIDQLSLRDESFWAMNSLNMHLLDQVVVFQNIEGYDLCPIDTDTTPLDNSGSKKEGVGLTYKKVMGYCPIISYIGSEGYMLRCELRNGEEHSNTEGTFDYMNNLIGAVDDLKIDNALHRLDSGFDDKKLMLLISDSGQKYIIKRNPRKEDKQEIIQKIKKRGKRILLRPGLIHWYYMTRQKIRVEIEGEWKECYRRVIYHYQEERINKQGQGLLVPRTRLDSYYTNLDKQEYEGEQIIKLYHDHGTSEQFHSELKTDMNVERLPSGKFFTNALLLQVAMVCFNILRLVGQSANQSSLMKRKRKVKRIRLGKVIDELMRMGSKFMIKNKIPTIHLPSINPYSGAFIMAWISWFT